MKSSHGEGRAVRRLFISAAFTCNMPRTLEGAGERCSYPGVKPLLQQLRTRTYPVSLGLSPLPQVLWALGFWTRKSLHGKQSSRSAVGVPRAHPTSLRAAGVWGPCVPPVVRPDICFVYLAASNCLCCTETVHVVCLRRRGWASACPTSFCIAS